MEDIEKDINLDISDTIPSEFIDDEIFKLIFQTLLSVDKTGELLKIFLTMKDDIIPYGESNIDELSLIYGVEPLFFSDSAFYVPSINKIFYEKTGTLFDVCAILHEFGHTLSGNIDSNSLSETIPVILEREAFKIFKSKGFSNEEINDVKAFRNVHIFEIITDLSNSLDLISKYINGEPLLEEDVPFYNKIVDQELKDLNNGIILSKIFNMYPYVIAYFISNNISDSSIILKWIEEGITPEEIFKSLGYSINEDVQVLS